MSQRKKKKGDASDPFTGYLTADEKILWVSGPPGLEWRDIFAVFSRRRFYVMSIGLAVLVITSVLILTNSRHLIPMMLIATAVVLVLGLEPVMNF